MNNSLSLSIVIPTYNREKVLLNSISSLLLQASKLDRFCELIVVDQTTKHESKTQKQLECWHKQGDIVWIKQSEAHLTRAMNDGLSLATGDIVLFTDDDIIPEANLLAAHLRAHAQHSDITAVVGQVLQPGEVPEHIDYTPRGKHLFRYLDFPFRQLEGSFVENVMAGNLSVVKTEAVALGGFDEAFLPPVASRFETEFAKRIVLSKGRIWFEPTASIHHLRASSGGTRSKGTHLNSASPRYSVGDYYYALRQGKGWERLWYVLRKPFREIRTRFHLRYPWWIPVKLLGEVRGFLQAYILFKQPPQLRRDFKSSISSIIS